MIVLVRQGVTTHILFAWGTKVEANGSDEMTGA